MKLLPGLILSNNINKIEHYSGIDSKQSCHDLTHFNQYPWPITYCYNSRGFRDQEWPEDIDQLKEAIWCIGDSFTVGIGSPLEHTWTHLLSQVTGKRTINISMDGASNNWISRIAHNIAQNICPKNIIIMWSYIHRREGLNNQDKQEVIHLSMEKFWKEYYSAIRGDSWPECATIEDFSKLPLWIKESIQKNHQAPQFIISDDLSSMCWNGTEIKRIHYINSLDQEDVENFQYCVDCVKLFNNDINVVHSVIPELSPAKLINTCEQIVNYNNQYVGYFSKLDLARDGHHFDRITAQALVNAMTPLLR